MLEGLLDEGARDEASPAGERLIELVGYNRIMRPFRLVRFVPLIQNIGKLLIFSSCECSGGLLVYLFATPAGQRVVEHVSYSRTMHPACLPA